MGRLYFEDTTGPNAFDIQEFVIAPDGLPLGQYLFGIGEDDDGELYVLASDSLGPTGSTGIVYKIVSGEPVPTVSEWGMIVLALLLLIGARIAFGGGRSTAMATIRA